MPKYFQKQETETLYSEYEGKQEKRQLKGLRASASESRLGGKDGRAKRMLLFTM